MPAEKTVISKGIKLLRQRMGVAANQPKAINQHRFADRLGVSQSTIQRYERGEFIGQSELMKMYELAIECGAADLAKIFLDAATLTVHPKLAENIARQVSTARRVGGRSGA